MHSLFTTSTQSATHLTLLTSISTHTTSATTTAQYGECDQTMVFKGVGNEDLNQLWFMVRAVWEAQGVVDDNIKKATLVSMLQDHTLTWYIKHSNDHPNARIAKIQSALNS